MLSVFNAAVGAFMVWMAQPQDDEQIPEQVRGPLNAAIRRL